MCLGLVQALLEGYNATDAVLRERVKGEGGMATVAFVCGRQLVVATAGTSCAYLDTGAHIYPVSHRHISLLMVLVLIILPLYFSTQSCYVECVGYRTSVLLYTFYVSVDDGVVASQQSSTHSRSSVDGDSHLTFCTLAHTHIHLESINCHTCVLQQTVRVTSIQTH